MKFKKIISSIIPHFYFLSLIIIFSPVLQAQNEAESHCQWGIEYDLMAPRIGAWNSVNLSGSLGHGRTKHSLVLAHIEINDRHLTDESFQEDELNALGYRFEIYSHRDLKKWSTGFLMLYTRDDVVTSANAQRGNFNSFFVGVPFGYTWVLKKKLTINPGINILVPLTNRKIKIGLDEVEQAPWGLEPGIRIGYRF
ncbi:MAG: hypothetical protein JXQ65_08805 [Candidatus Marinimicrobia bacterium]|nr:hypothetical protein [Candidatus Neomarinimicrobiota bacterium]